jgi:hypothetical protein
VALGSNIRSRHFAFTIGSGSATRRPSSRRSASRAQLRAFSG